MNKFSKAQASDFARTETKDRLEKYELQPYEFDSDECSCQTDDRIVQIGEDMEFHAPAFKGWRESTQKLLNEK